MRTRVAVVPVEHAIGGGEPDAGAGRALVSDRPAGAALWATTPASTASSNVQSDCTSVDRSQLRMNRRTRGPEAGESPSALPSHGTAGARKAGSPGIPVRGTGGRGSRFQPTGLASAPHGDHAGQEGRASSRVTAAAGSAPR